MNILDLIDAKKKKKCLDKAQIDYFIKGVCNGSIADYQTSALLMAIVLNGMNEEETFFLTMAMLNSGKVLKRDGICGVICDKHSTGGVSDSTTLIIVPVVCSLGLKVAKFSGRGLGFTGGTLDKLESFKGFDVNLENFKLIECINSVGAFISGQTTQTVPADKKLYALRDVTGTVDSIPLIASSIMSKKLSSFADIIVLDVKYGSGAFMKDKESALALAREMVKIGKKAGRKTAAFVTSMQQPLGNFIGCDLEVMSAINVLKGEKNDLFELSLALSAKIIQLNESCTYSEAYAKCQSVIDNGKALEKLKEIVAFQSGSLEKFEKFDIKADILTIKSLKKGIINKIDSEKLGKINIMLGGGRIKKDDEIDHSVGIELLKRIGDSVKINEPVLKIYHKNKGVEEALKTAYTVFEISDNKPKKDKLIEAYID